MIVKVKMKICAIICEFNPFHNGHRYLIEQAKKLSKCDKIICIMSGSFTQRGDIAVFDKFTRARHAVLCGADAVLELPVSFSVAPAEIFARGAIKILSAIPEVATLAFGCENPGSDFVGAARILNKESKKFKKVLNENLADGESYIKSYEAAFVACGGEENLLSRPNNILAVEYAKAILNTGAMLEILPVGRVGSQFDEDELKSGFSSAKAIRKNADSPLVKDSVPECVFTDFLNYSDKNPRFEEFLRFKLLQSSPETLQKIYGCTEGLENRLLNLADLPFGQIIENATARRYSSSRIKRILTANLLGLYAEDCMEYLAAPLYLKPIVIKKERSDEIMAALAKSEFPVILKQRNLNELNEVAKKCFKCDENSYRFWTFIAEKPESGFDYPKFI